ncbi:peptide chain release factor N(5)-glutamine methyltransferase [Roseicyclus marinus]|uniref:peptide chain release factor N(5)-glutamine methyltransferase n=1 Tax=Roseicyclus marinus TaxID=2161673 RepID=UPI0024108140|nr:peptide chain release factor N(5)-glutamine methyltransferase [Roseicyclus marinus]MDG3042902.1 peptide chain release factor N(5)-glutamine methyltransferase [Roseicyclus marinus]
MKAGAWLQRTGAVLEPMAGREAAREARLMLRAASGWSPARVAVARDDMLDPAVLKLLEAMLARRLAREPLALILGEWEFFGRSFAVTRDTLVPRPDTETLVELALAEPFGRVIDLGTGSGAIAVTLLAERTGAEGVAVDVSEGALQVAAANAARHGVAGRLAFERGDWWQGVTGEFDLIVSNPPYVSAAEYEALQPEITQWEPRAALTPGGDELSAYRAILGGVGAHARPGGRVLVEIGAAQGEAVAALFTAAGLQAVEVHLDMAGKARVVSGRVPAATDCG